MKNKFYLLIAFSIFLCLGYKPKDPKILIIGDSISIGYFSKVKEALATKAIVMHNPGNAQHTGTGLEKIKDWIGKEDWDIIQFNWGLWDLCYRHPDSKVYGNRDKIKGTITYDLQT
ncbi:MAG: SGNH/GDSL hydrolase family protein, partial [Arenibacter algicola]|nr:SGNH/GDSL hydrolase family protein [Arenibacter algicola]